MTNDDNLLFKKLESLDDFTKKVLQRLSVLHSLDLGMESSFFLRLWRLETIQTPLTYLRITVSTINTMLQLMLTRPLRHTLQQFHVKLNDVYSATHHNISAAKLLPKMEALHTFTFVKSFNWHFMEEWTLLDILTFSSIMPILRRMNFAIVMNFNDLNQMNHSALFNDDRHVDIHYVFIVNDNRLHSKLSKYVSCGSKSHSRKIASATFISDCWPDNQLFTTPGEKYVSYHLLYNFHRLFQQ